MNIYIPEPRSGRVAFVRNQVILIMRTDLNCAWSVRDIHEVLKDCRLNHKQIYQALHTHANAFRSVSLGRWKLVSKYANQEIL